MSVNMMAASLRCSSALIFELRLSSIFVALAQRAVAHHVGEHDGGEFALLVGAHFCAFPNSRLRRDTMLAQLRVSCSDDKGSNSTGNRNLLRRFCTYRVPGKRRVSLTAVDHFWSLKSTEYWVVSQVTFIVPPLL